MSHALLSASGSHKWLNCPPSARLEENYPNKNSVFTIEGTMAHELCEKINSNYFKGTNYSVEGYDSEAALHAEAFHNYVKEIYNGFENPIIEFEKRVNFSAWVPEGFGTADVLLADNSKLVIIDFKYGKGVEVSAYKNPQLMLYALGSVNEYDWLFNFQEIAVIVYQPRIDNISSYSLSAEELLKWGDTVVKPKAELAFDGAGDYCAGEHCKKGFCRARGSCRAYAERHLKLLQYEFKDADQLLPDEYADILNISRTFSDWLENVKASALLKMLDGTAIKGFKVVEGRANRKISDEFQAAEILQNNGYSDNDIYKKELIGIAALEKLLTKKKFNQLLKDLIVKPNGAPTIAPETDKRPEYNSAAIDFKNMEV